MKLFALADLHLSGSVHKPMDKFGSRWTDHAEKIRTRWSRLVRDDDTVVIPGDISWAADLEEAADDFRFIASLPGKKIISKGNHDFWWTGLSKMKKFLRDLGIDSIDFLHNNALCADGFILTGTRGWFIEEKLQSTVFPTDYEKLVNREVIRLGLSLDEAEKMRSGDEEILVFLHFPPLWSDFVCEPILETMTKRGVRRCFFGHIHGVYNVPGVTRYGELELRLISSDYLDFIPQYIAPRNPEKIVNF